MPRARVVPPSLPDDDDEALVTPGAVPPDPRPRASRGAGRPRKTAPKLAGNRGRIATRTASGRIMSEAQMVAKVRAELGMWLEIAAGGWEAADPECAASLFEPIRTGQPRLDAIADRLTAIVARNKTLLVSVSKTGIVGDVVALLALLAPVGKTMWQTHGPSGRGHSDTGVSDDLNNYPAYTGAAAG